MKTSVHPASSFLILRFVISWSLGLLVSWPIQGFVGDWISHQPEELQGRTLLGPIPVHSAAEQWEKTRQLWELNPENCIPGPMQSDFARAECEALQSRRRVALGIVALPWGIGFLWAILVVDTLRAFYRRSQKGLALSGRVFLAQVASRRVAGMAIFGWWYGYQPVLVQNSRRGAFIVWIPFMETQPRPGQQLACVEMGHWLFRPRIVGKLYAPDVFVI